MQPFEKTYDFDQASKEWMKNKTKLGSGQYKYICGHLTTKGKKCLRKPLKRKKVCFYHYKSTVQVGNRSEPKENTKG